MKAAFAGGEGGAEGCFHLGETFQAQQGFAAQGQGFHIAKTDHTEFTARVALVLMKELIEFDLTVLDNYVKATYPDLRKCLQLVQQNSQDGALKDPRENDAAVKDWRLDCVQMFKAGRLREARTLMCNQASVNDTEEIFRWMYDNLDLWGSTPEQQDDAIKIIRTGLVNHSMVADAEINLAATLIELGQLA